MADAKKPYPKQPGEKPEGKYHYNPGNMSGKKAKVTKDDRPAEGDGKRKN